MLLERLISVWTGTGLSVIVASDMAPPSRTHVHSSRYLFASGEIAEILYSSWPAANVENPDNPGGKKGFALSVGCRFDA